MRNDGIDFQPIQNESSIDFQPERQPGPLERFGELLGSIPRGIADFAEAGYGTGKEIAGSPLTGLENLATASGRSLASVPYNIAHSTGLSKHLPFQIPDFPVTKTDPASQFGQMIGPMAIGGPEAKLAEGLVAKGLEALPSFFGKSVLGGATKLAASGAAQAPTYGQSIGQGALTNLVAGAPFSAAAKVAEYRSRPASLTKQITDTGFQSHTLPRVIYNKMGANYENFKPKVKAAYQAVDNLASQKHDYDPSSFYNYVKNEVGRLKNKAQTEDVKSQLNILMPYLQKQENIPSQVSSIVGPSGERIQTAPETTRDIAPPKKLESFGDAIDLDQDINKKYGDYNLDAMPGVKRQLASLKKALYSNMDDNSQNIPASARDAYNHAKNMHKQLKSYQMLDENTVSPFFKRWSRESEETLPDGSKVKSPLLNSNNANPGRLLKDYIKPSDSMEDHTALMNHMMGLLNDEDKPLVGAAWIASQNDLKGVARQLGKLNPDQRNAMFGRNTPLANQLEQMNREYKKTGKLSKSLARTLSFIEGAHLGHPVMGYAAGSLIPKMESYSESLTPSFWSQERPQSFLRSIAPTTLTPLGLQQQRDNQ